MLHILFWAIAVIIANADLSWASSISDISDDILIQDSKVDIKDQAIKSIKVEEKTQSSKPSLESVLQNHSQIQVLPTPLGGSNLSLHGLGGEYVSITQDGDPILGRVDGALDSRSLMVNSIENIKLYQGLDSLPYGSQNIAGVVALESPWKLLNKIEVRGAGGSSGRSLVSTKFSRKYAQATLNLWRTNAVRLGDIYADTVSDASAKISGSALFVKQNVTQIYQNAVDIRLGVDGSHDNSRGVFGALLSESKERRVHIFSDLKRKNSLLHFSYSKFNKEYVSAASGLRSDSFKENAFRISPQLQETYGAFTVLAGSTADFHTTISNRIQGGKIATIDLGGYFGSRYVLNDSWSFGLGTRYDSSPNLFSPRAEIKHYISSEISDHISTIEGGLSFREPTAKEKFLEYANPSVGYRVIGNPDLSTEKSSLIRLRHQVEINNVDLEASAFYVDLKDAIGFQVKNGVSGGPFTYENISKTRTFGTFANVLYNLPLQIKPNLSYQWLNGKNLENNSLLFMQPAHRATFGFFRSETYGLLFNTSLSWTAKQGYFDFNRNRVLDGQDYVGAFWLANLEIGYGFKIKSISEMIRLTARIDNLMNFTRKDSFPREPRGFLIGGSIYL